jgi:drug/metabolite transporter (DMT)-like permease
VVGLGLGVLSALAFGITVVLGRSLAKADLGFPTSLGIPFVLGGLILLGVLRSRGAPLLPAPGERVWVGFLGAGVYAVQSAFFFSGLERGTAAAATLLFYAYPAMVVVAEIPLARRWPSSRTTGAVVLSIGGVALLVATSGEVDITGFGAAFALGAGALFGLNLLVTEWRVHRSEPMAVAAWLAIGTGAAQLAWGAAHGALHEPGEHWPALLGLGVDRALAFAFMYLALRRLGPTDTAVILTFEALFAATLAAAFLGETVAGVQAVGGAAIVGAAMIIARTSPPPEADPVDAHVPST